MKYKPLAKMTAREVCREIRPDAQAGRRVSAVRYIRRWLVAAGYGDSYVRACTLYQDVVEDRHWTR